MAMKVERIKRLSAARYMERHNGEVARLRGHYCNLFKFWRTCPVKLCRRMRSCRGDQQACLKRCIGTVPRHEQYQARLRILAATSPAHSPERTARENMANELREVSLRPGEVMFMQTELARAKRE
jgi:hypothetical protein